MMVTMRETAMMVTMVKSPQCVEDLLHAYRLENMAKYYHFERYKENFDNMREASETPCTGLEAANSSNSHPTLGILP